MIGVHQKTFFYEQLGSRHEWEEFSNRYETVRRLELVYKKLLHPDEVRGSRFLDAGSGGGHFSAAAAEAGAEVWSLDVGENLLAQVASRCESHGVIGSVLDMPFEDGFFDVVLCTEVIEHSPNPLRAVRELARVVRSGGILVITTPCKLWQPLVRLASILKLRPFNGYENFLWPRDLIRAVHSQNFSIEWSQGFNFCPFFNAQLDRLFRMCDNWYGGRFPWLMVNIGIRARRTGETTKRFVL